MIIWRFNKKMFFYILGKEMTGRHLLSLCACRRSLWFALKMDPQESSKVNCLRAADNQPMERQVAEPATGSISLWGDVNGFLIASDK